MSCIIVEGSDNCGKTTLVKHLAGTFGLPTLVSAFASRSAYGERIVGVWENFLELMKSDGQFVADRCALISECVYGPILKGQDDLVKVYGSEKYAQQVEEFTVASRLIIYCRPPLEVINDFGDRDQLEEVIANSNKLVSTYDEVMRLFETKLGVDVYRYDWTEPGALEKLEAYVSQVLGG